MFKAEKVAFRYRQGPYVLREVDLEIEEREILAVIGATGSGKSTLLKLLAGLLRPQQGRVLFEDQVIDLENAEMRERLAKARSMTFQLGALFDSWTCEENLDFPLRELTEFGRNTRMERTRQILARVGLEGTEKRFVSELSGGMQKRLALARALILEPRCVFLDDPTAGLDPVTGRSILDLIGSLGDEKDMTVVLVSSEIPRALKLASRVAFLHEGRLAALGTPGELKEKGPETWRAFLRGEFA